MREREDFPCVTRLRRPPPDCFACNCTALKPSTERYTLQRTKVSVVEVHNALEQLSPREEARPSRLLAAIQPLHRHLT